MTLFSSLLVAPDVPEIWFYKLEEYSLEELKKKRLLEFEISWNLTAQSLSANSTQFNQMFKLEAYNSAGSLDV